MGYFDNFADAIYGEAPSPRRNNSYLNYYQDAGGRFPNYYDPVDYANEEELERLKQITTKDSGASQLLESYYGQMPMREDYSPSWGRRIAGFLAGTLGRTGYAGARDFIEQPYYNAVDEWKMQAPGVAQRAKNMEAAQNRELTGAKLSIQNRLAAEKAGAVDRRFGAGQAARLASGATNSENTDQNQALAQQKLEEQKRATAERERDTDQNRELHKMRIENANLERTSREEARKAAAESNELLKQQRLLNIEEDKRKIAKAKALDKLRELYPQHFEVTGKLKDEVDDETLEQMKLYGRIWEDAFLSGAMK